MKLVIIRHGESEANKENYWTGWLDVNLTETGMQQAKLAGEKIRDSGIQFDAAYCSVLKRAIKTAEIILGESGQLFVSETKTWRLNERHYGALVGVNKDEMVRQFGKEQVKRWRRGYRELPPLVEENHFDRRYEQLDPRLIPTGESLAMTASRVLPLWEDQLAPQLLDGKNLLVVGHGNSLRALVKFLEAVPDDQVDKIDIPNASPVVYTFNSELSIISKETF